jgi:hypothetical protein
MLQIILDTSSFYAYTQSIFFYSKVLLFISKDFLPCMHSVMQGIVHCVLINVILHEKWPGFPLLHRFHNSLIKSFPMTAFF